MKKIKYLWLMLAVLLCLTACSKPSYEMYEVTEVEGGVSVKYYAEYAEIQVDIPDKINGQKVVAIGDEAFFQNDTVEAITIPDTVTSIGAFAFQRCYVLGTVNIPASVEAIGESAFFRCSMLEEINVDEENANYTSIDGVLYNKDATELLCYPEGKTDIIYQVPDTVRKFSEESFGYRPGVKEIYIPNSVNEMPDYNIFLFSEDITFHVKEGTVAHTYVEQHGLNYVLD